VKGIELEIFNKLFSSIAEEMGIVLRRSAFSPNIRERCDFSCAIFDATGELVSQASHIPVHLGAMPETMKRILPLFEWKQGDIVITNDPFCGGTHLPDVTLIKPVFFNSKLKFFLINRAHHADIGGKFAGSMAVSTSIEEEGIRITPRYLYKEGSLDEKFFKCLISSLRNPHERYGDFNAQIASLRRGEQRLLEMLKAYGEARLEEACFSLKKYSETAMRSLLREIPKAKSEFEDFLDDDGVGTKDIAIRVRVEVLEDEVIVDFSKSDPQVRGCVNAPVAVTQSCVYYVFLCLLNTKGEYPINHGCFKPIKIITKSGTIVDAEYPSAVAGGNVETSQRIVDAILGALSEVVPELIPAASCGSMNNIAIGNESFAYYETIAGGMGARPGKDGLSAVHTHMTNTLNTPVEALEHEYPIVIEEYRIRNGSGGKGKFRGGDGLVRSFLFLQDCSVTILSERRLRCPYGLFGGEPGKCGENWLIKADGKRVKLDPKVNLHLKKGDKIVMLTPGGGGWGKVES